MDQKHKKVKHGHEPGDCHELTFSCYHQMQLLADDDRRKMLCASIDAAMARHDFRLIAFVLMPEHIHLLVYPAGQSEVEDFLYAVKRPFSYRVKLLMQERNDPLLETLTIQERPGKMTFRFWQEGPGYDRNMHTERAVMASIDYIHQNPVRRGLVAHPRDWKWSSYRWYESEKAVIDKDLPTIHGLPPGFFTRI